MLNGEGAKKHMLLIKLLKAEVVDRQRAGVHNFAVLFHCNKHLLLFY